MRADARRNYDHLVATARAVFAEEGPEASLNEVARRAGVGPGTLYRHFPTREALLVAVFRERIEKLCGRAAELCGHPSPGEALAVWLRAMLVHVRTDGGLSATMLTPATLGFDCHAKLRAAGDSLLDRAQESGQVRRDVDLEDLFQLVVGISKGDRGEHLLSVALDGLKATAP